MRAGGDDPFDAIMVETFNIFSHKLFKKSRFSHPPDLTPTALFLVSQYTEVDLSALEIEGQRLGNLLNAGIRGSSAPYKIKIFSPISLGEVFDLEILGEFLCPLCSLIFWFSPRIPMFVRIFHGLDERLGDMPLFNQKAPHPDDQIHGLESTGAPDCTGFTGGAVPELQPLAQMFQISSQDPFDHQSADIQPRLQGNRTPTRALPALITTVELQLLSHGLFRYIHLFTSSLIRKLIVNYFIYKTKIV
jgi:hypothetical protein